DFGLAKFTETESLTMTGTALGTPAYMAPEQAVGQPASIRSDIWALGVVLFEMLSGRRPFNGDNMPSVLRAIAQDPPPPLGGFSDSVQQVVYRCLAKDPGLRYQKAEDLIEDLKPLASQSQQIISERIGIDSRRLRDEAFEAATTVGAGI